MTTLDYLPASDRIDFRRPLAQVFSGAAGSLLIGGAMVVARWAILKAPLLTSASNATNFTVVGAILAAGIALLLCAKGAGATISGRAAVAAVLSAVLAGRILLGIFDMWTSPVQVVFSLDKWLATGIFTLVFAVLAGTAIANTRLLLENLPAPAETAERKYFRMLCVGVGVFLGAWAAYRCLGIVRMRYLGADERFRQFAPILFIGGVTSALLIICGLRRTGLGPMVVAMGTAVLALAGYVRGPLVSASRLFEGHHTSALASAPPTQYYSAAENAAKVHALYSGQAVIGYLVIGALVYLIAAGVRAARPAPDTAADVAQRGPALAAKCLGFVAAGIAMLSGLQLVRNAMLGINAPTTQFTVNHTMMWGTGIAGGVLIAMAVFNAGAAARLEQSIDIRRKLQSYASLQAVAIVAVMAAVTLQYALPADEDGSSASTARTLFIGATLLAVLLLLNTALQRLDRSSEMPAQ